MKKLFNWAFEELYVSAPKVRELVSKMARKGIQGRKTNGR